MTYIPPDYYGMIAGLESSGDPNAYNKATGASGLYQFLPSTWKNLGYSQSDIFNVDMQQAAIQKLTQQNASYLSSHGIPINDQTLYTAHVLGAPHAAQVLSADPSTPLGNILSRAAIMSNSFLGSTVGSAISALGNKVGNVAGGIANSLGDAATSLGNKVDGAVSDAKNAATDTFGFITHPVTSIIEQIQSWLFNSSFFTRLALAIFAIIVLTVGFLMLKPTQNIIANGAKLAA